MDPARSPSEADTLSQPQSALVKSNAIWSTLLGAGSAVSAIVGRMMYALRSVSQEKRKDHAVTRLASLLDFKEGFYPFNVTANLEGVLVPPP